ncbi:MAG: methyl-accepting chemotaxis protein [Aquabacterium sp.]|nr:methyl-accepting chemotaxis protein [Aquabacterium sp.]
MNSIKTLTVRASMLWFVALAAFGAGLLGAVALAQASDNEALTDRLLGDLQLVQAVGTTDMLHEGLLATTRAALLAGPTAADAVKAEVRAELAERRKTIAEAMAQVAAGATDGPVRTAAHEVQPVVEGYSQAALALVDAGLSGSQAAGPLRTAFDAEFKRLEVSLDKLSGLIESEAEHHVAQREAQFARQRLVVLVLLAATVATLLGVGLRFAAQLIRRLGAEPARLRQFAQGIAGGALYTEFDGARPVEGSVAAAMIAMRDHLREAVASIRAGADSVATGSAQIASGNEDLAARTEQQAGSLQQTASGMAQMTGIVHQTAEHARAASDLAATASSVAEHGGEAVQRVVQTIGDIQDSSRRIADITNVIDGIAFQTNILALNAAVEAARAGEQGRGFAVVASEVRSLAQRSATAAREIKDLIANSVEKVNAGGRLAADAGATMGEIVVQVKRVNDLIAGISVAANEQTEGIGQVSRSVASLDQSTQQNSALVEESAAAAGMLKDQAARLADAVGAFRLQTS